MKSSKHWFRSRSITGRKKTREVPSCSTLCYAILPGVKRIHCSCFIPKEEERTRNSTQKKEKEKKEKEKKENELRSAGPLGREAALGS